MKFSLTNFAFFSQAFNTFRRAAVSQTPKRIVSLLLIAALFTPLVFFGQPQTTFAALLWSEAARVSSAPPEPFVSTSVKASSSDSFLSLINIWSNFSFLFGSPGGKNGAEEEPETGQPDSSAARTEIPAQVAAEKPTSASSTINNTATFVRADTTTQGNWVGSYGSQSYQIIGDGSSIPPWLQFAVTGQTFWTEAASTSDPRALVKPGNNNDRIAAVWLSTPLDTVGAQWEMDFNFTDGQPHQLALYCLDWDPDGIVQEIEIADPATGNVLDVRPLSNFTNGVYLVWQVKGQIKVRVRNMAASSHFGIVSGIFVDNAASAANSFDAVTDFSTANNPAGAWSYGYKTAPSSFVAYTYSGQPWSGISSWSPNWGGACCQMLAKNVTGATQTYEGRVTQSADLLNLHPGANGERSTLRWTASAAGVYQIAGRFQGIDTVGTTTDVHILHNGAEVWANNINGYGAQTPYNFSRTVNTGDVIEFAVGYGGNNNYQNDSTGLAAIITPSGGNPTPTPTPVVTPTPMNAELSRARLSPKNATGGTNLYSRNFGWSAGLAGLPGRGLGAGFGISYNSLVWTRQGNDVVFNADNSNVTPGFRFGYPVVEPSYADNLTGKNTYLMVTPSGARVEFRQTNGAADTFETPDSSYAQIKVTGTNTLTVLGTDGTQTFYELKGGAFRVSQIKDANGNFVTVNHDANGRLQTVIDTLGRTVTIIYDPEGDPESIVQQRQNGTHTYAIFAYTYKTLGTNFPGLNLVGAQNGAKTKVLRSVRFADQSSVRFDYNAYGQVWRVNNHAADGHKLNHVAVNLENVSEPQTDCPRFTETRSWAENFNVAGGQAQEIVIPNGHQENQTFTLPDNTQATGTLIETSAPDGTISKTYVGGGGWMEGLPVLSEDWANEGGSSARKRWNYTAYTQDNPNLGYILNPRAVETKTGDSTNVRRTTVGYHPQFGLVNEVTVYDADQTSVLKRAVTDYNLDNAYLSRRIVGLPAESKLFDGNDNLVSKVTYQYDEGDFSGAGQTVAPIQHDAANYGAGFVTGRGNLTSTTRWDVNTPSDANRAVTSRVGYNTAGLPTAQIDPLNRTVSINYADSFDDDINRNTFAYPTALTDPAGNSSTVKYRFDTGANVYAVSPAPAGNPQGKTTQRIYDALGRLEKETVNNTGAYTRYEYPANGVQSRVFSTVTDVNDNGADAADEVLNESYFNGAGAVRMSRTEHPGSAGGWSATVTEYDVMGRVKRQSVPTEVDTEWNPAGDDAARGWLWNEQEYDWKGRVTRQINTDGTDKLFSYEGCGCAGGQMTTIRGEQLQEGRRTQKIYEDILGRTYKSETLNWDGSVYSTVKTTFDGRDRAVLVRQYQGTENSSVFQDTTLTYDGHGRLKTQHRPEQNANTATVLAYNADDTLSLRTDARGATAAYAYDERALVTRIDYVLPGAANPTPTPTPPATNSPIGNFDGIDTMNRTAWGWTLDADNGAASNVVQFYVDGAAGTGQFAGSATASQARADVNQQTGQPGNHGFVFDIPARYADGNQHAIYAYAVDAATNERTLLGGAPQYFAFSPMEGQNPKPEEPGGVVSAQSATPFAAPPVNASVTFSYDAPGNRTSMQDAQGTQTYEYNQLSQLVAETRRFNDALPSAPLADNSFKLQYAYSLSGQLKSLTDPYGQQINYGHDRAGRLNSVTGSNFGGVTNYANNPQYRAWGALKGLSYGNGAQMSLSYNNRLQANSLELSGGGEQVMRKNYEYYADGNLRYLQDVKDARFDRLNRYDHLGRIIEGKSGAEARGQAVVQSDMSSQLPYRQSYQYDAFNHLTQRNYLHWGVENWYGQSNNLNYTYQNNRINGYSYDADGRVLATAPPDEYNYSTYDAAGMLITLSDGQSDIHRYYDGNGREVKRVRSIFVENPNATAPPYGQWENENTYYIRSSIMGNETISEVDYQGKKIKSYVKAAGATIATQNVYSATNQQVKFEHWDASGMSYRNTDKDGNAQLYSGTDFSPGELDPMGGNAGTETPYIEPINPEPIEPQMPQAFNLFEESPRYVNGQRQTCMIDGMEMPSVSYCDRALESGTAIPASIAHLQGQPGFRYESVGLGIFRVFIPGSNNAPPPGMSGRGESDEDGVIRVDNYGTNDRWETFYFSTSWDMRGQQQQVNPFEKFASKTKLSDKDCDIKLSKIFGGVAKAMEKAGDINGTDRLGNGPPAHSATPASRPFVRDLKTGKMKRNPDNGGIIHTYTDAKGSARTDIPLYTPGGWIGVSSYYEGGNSALVVNYSGGITIEFVHAGTFNISKKPSIPNDPGAGNLAEIGFVAGYGGGFGGKGKESTAMVIGDIAYNHTHIVFFSNKAKNERLDPRKLFCGW